MRVPDEHGAVAGSWKTVLAGTSTVSELEEATLFELAQMNIRMTDVGGQRSEWEKWIHSFDGIQCLVFMVAFSRYYQCLIEVHYAVCLLPSLQRQSLMDRLYSLNV